MLVDPYSLHGYGLNDGTSSSIAVDGAFKDQIYFETADSSPAYLSFEFNLDITVSATGTGEPGGVYFVPRFVVDNRFFVLGLGETPSSIEDSYFEVGSYHETVTYSTNGNMVQEMVDSGTYLPIDIAAFTIVLPNTEMDWLDSMTLDAVRAFDATGNELSPDQFIATSDALASVPEPSTLALMSFGLIGIGIASRKKQ